MGKLRSATWKLFARAGTSLRGRLWLASPRVIPTQIMVSAGIALVITWALPSMLSTARAELATCATAASIGVLHSGAFGSEPNTAAIMPCRAMEFFSMASLGVVAVGAPLLGWIADVLRTRDAAQVRASAAIASRMVLHVALRSREPESRFASRPRAETTRASAP